MNMIAPCILLLNVYIPSRAWQAVALLPFIDEARLRAAMRECEASFTPQEKNRNRQGHSLIFVHASHPLSPAFKAIGPDTPTTDQSEHDVAYLSSTTSAKDGKEVSVKSSEKGVLEPPAGTMPLHSKEPVALLFMTSFRKEVANTNRPFRWHEWFLIIHRTVLCANRWHHSVSLEPVSGYKEQSNILRVLPLSFFSTGLCISGQTSA